MQNGAVLLVAKSDMLQRKGVVGRVGGLFAIFRLLGREQPEDLLSLSLIHICLNERVILKAVRDECREKTVLLVSHRRSTMAVADLSFSVERDVYKRQAPSCTM